MPNSIVNTRQWKKDALNAKAVVFNAGQIALNTDPAFAPTFSSVTADITEPTVGGYVRQAPTFGAAVNFGVGDAQLVGALMTWTFAAGGFTIHTICQIRGGDNVLLWCFQLDTPVTIAGPGPWQFVPTYADGDY